VECLVPRYDVLGFGLAGGGDDVLRQVVLGRIIKSTSKQDSARCWRKPE